MASRLDPLGLVDRAGATLGTIGSVAQWGERQVLSILRARLDATVPAGGDGAAAAGSSTEGLDDKMNRLLDRAVEQSSRSGRQELFHKILDQLVPDEARIIGALADGSSSPLINVYARNRAGLVGEVVLENASLIGKSANLALPHLTPTYVSHLLSLGLLETGPEDTTMKADYDILSVDTTVLRALKKAARGPIPARIERYSLRLSGLGLELWAAANQPSRSSD
jgi:Abortive infection alpha